MNCHTFSFYSFTWETVTIYVQVVNYESSFILFECSFLIVSQVLVVYFSYSPCFYIKYISMISGQKTWRLHW